MKEPIPTPEPVPLCPGCCRMMVEKPLFTSVYWGCDYCDGMDKHDPEEIMPGDPDPFDPFYDDKIGYPSNVAPPVDSNAANPFSQGTFSWQCAACQAWDFAPYGATNLKCSMCGYCPPGQTP